ncbi:MAG: 30S ribosomal protein S12 methylthiotransferase RimO [Bacteroidales bacterium]
MSAKIKLLTLGCSKNRVDSEHLLRQIYDSKIGIVPENEDLSSAGADTLIINTCGFIKDAKEESVEAILTAVEEKKRGVIKKIFVFGCLSQRYREELTKEIPEVDGFFGAFDARSVIEALGKTWDESLNNRRYLTTPSHYAYLKISEGCDRICSYCSIPLIRGGHKSVPIEELTDEAHSLVAQGVKELIVVAQDTTYYGVDLYKERRVAKLLESLCRVDGIEWVRLLYSYPAAFPDNILDVIASEPKMCKYLDIPLQHINDKVLTNMRRSVDGKSIRSLIERIRSRVPGIALRTTMIVGHPGESEKAFKELLDFVQEAKFERLGAFTYSEEEGTWGAMNLRDSIKESVKQRRYEELMEVQSLISLNHNRSRVGKTERVLIDSFSEGTYTARSMYESPEVDGEILIKANSLHSHFTSKENIGTFVDVRIDNADEYDLFAKFV